MDSARRMLNYKTRTSKTERAGCVLSVARIERNLRKGDHGKRIATTSAVYMAASIEYLVAEVLELAGSVARNDGRIRITPHHIKMAIEEDAELKELLKNVHIPDAGVRPGIHPALLPKNSRRDDDLVQLLRNVQIGETDDEV